MVFYIGAPPGGSLYHKQTYVEDLCRNADEENREYGKM